MLSITTFQMRVKMLPRWTSGLSVSSLTVKRNVPSSYAMSLDGETTIVVGAKLAE
jgi:hypothetical protein